MITNKKKVLLIGDMPGWAYDNIITFVYTQFKKDYDFYYDYTIYNPRHLINQTTDCPPGLVINEFISKHYKKDFVSYRIPIFKSFAYRIRKFLNIQGLLVRDAEGKKRRVRKDNTYDCVVFLDYYMNLDGNFDSIITNSVIRGIYTDGFPPRGYNKLEPIKINEFTSKYFHGVKVFLTGSKSIKELYEKHFDGKTFAANLAYDENIFKPSKINKEYKNQLNKLKIGWTGNPNRAFKGFYEVIQPVINELINEGYNIELKSQFQGELNSLATFWQQVDLAVIMSEADAGPSMFMEASLCGVPSISTKIGMPSEIIIDNKNGKFIDRDKEQLKNQIIVIYNDRQILSRWSESIRNDYIDKLGVKAQIENWRGLFNSALE
jgi:glycosyltransferase involved in cell wall biosynthesis